MIDMRLKSYQGFLSAGKTVDSVASRRLSSLSHVAGDQSALQPEQMRQIESGVELSLVHR